METYQCVESSRVIDIFGPYGIIAVVLSVVLVLLGTAFVAKKMP